MTMYALGAPQAPWDSRRQLRLLRDHWVTLYNQVVGRGAAPRSDIDPSIQEQITLGFQNFDQWYRGVSESFMSDMFGAYGSSWPWNQSELDVQLQAYNTAVELAQAALAPIREPVLTCPLPVTKVQRPSLWSYALVSVAGVVATLGVQLWLSRRKRRRSV